jgi:hypothetical protein
MANKKQLGVLALILACQRKILRIILQKDISENQKLFDELARL